MKPICTSLIRTLLRNFYLQSILLHNYNLKNTKTSFDIDVLNTVPNRNKHYEKFKQSGREIDKCNFKNAKVLLKKVINYKKTLYLEDKIRENKNNPIKFW